MNTRRFFATVLVLGLCAAGAFAQAAGGPGGGPVSASVQPTVSVQMGSDFGYNLGTRDIGSSFDMSLMLTLTDNLQAAVTFLNGDGTNFQGYRLLELYYSVIPRLGAVVSAGAQVPAAGPAVPAMGVGLYSNILGRNVQGSLQTGLRLLVGYLAPIGGAGFSTGTIRFGIVAWLGM